MESEAKSINSRQWVVGWSKGPGNSRAVIRKGTGTNVSWLDLNDKHLVFGLGDPGTGGWSLLEAVAISQDDYVVGNGFRGTPTVLPSVERAFLLIKRNEGN